MVECLLDDTIRFVEFAKKNKKRLKTINIANDFNYKEENFTIIHENLLGERDIIFTLIRNTLYIDDLEENKEITFSYQESIVPALDFIQKYLDEREKKYEKS